jgi:hypothetical protein
MKKREAFVLISVFMAITFLWGMAPSATGQEKVKPEAPAKEPAPFMVTRLVVGTGVEDREPVGVAETFASSTEKVYCFLEATDITKDTEVTFVWYHGQEEMRQVTLPLMTGPRWRTYAYKNLMGLKGDWKVEIKDAGGEVLKEVTFKVE